MAKESGSDDSAPDSRPISVAELLARQRSEEQDAGGQQSATAAGREGRGRRRVGRDGSRSVAELTGEIPRISDDPAHPLPPQPTPQQSPEPPPGLGAHGGPAGRGSAFPRSSDPTVRRPGDGRPVADPPPPRPAAAGHPTASGMPGFAGPAGTRDFNAGDVADRMRAPAADVPGSQGPPADPIRTEAVTGIIPVTDDRADQAGPGRDVVDRDDLVGVDLDAPPADSHPSTRSSGFAEVMDDDFEAYRSFSDVEKPTRPKPARTGLLGKLKRKAKGGADKAAGAAVVTGGVAAAAAEAIVHRASHPDAPSHGGDTDTHPNTDVPAGHVPDGAFRPDGDPRSATPDRPTTPGATGSAGLGLGTFDAPGLSGDTQQRGLGDLVSGPAGQRTGSAGETTGSAGGTTASAADAPTSFEVPDDRRDGPRFGDPRTGRAPEDRAADASTSTFGPATGAVAGPGAAGAAGLVGRRRRADDDADGPDTAVAGTLAADTGSTETRAADTVGDDAANRGGSGRRSGKRARTPSPLVAWLSVIGQAIVGLAIGVGLFWGFVELWKWNVYFALVLAVVVIFGIVAITHLIRRNRDLPTTLLALAVGLIVTIGPLVVLLAA